MSRILSALLVLALVGCAQTDTKQAEAFYELEGQLIDAELDMPLVGANVELVGTGIGAATGPDGSYLIRSVPAGSYTLSITHGGRTVKTEEIEIPGTDVSHAKVLRKVDGLHEAPKADVPAVDHEEVFVVVEQMPKPIGGMEQLAAELKYPELAKKAGIEGRVIVRFIVDEDGVPYNGEVVRGIGAGCDEEALRAAMTLRFTPGMQRGKAVKVQMSLPVVFKLS